MKKDKTGIVSSRKLRAIMNEITEQICQAQDRISMSLSDRAISIRLEIGTINITMNESQKGGTR